MCLLSLCLRRRRRYRRKQEAEAAAAAAPSESFLDDDADLGDDFDGDFDWMFASRSYPNEAIDERIRLRPARAVLRRQTENDDGDFGDSWRD